MINVIYIIITGWWGVFLYKLLNYIQIFGNDLNHSNLKDIYNFYFFIK